MGGSQSRDIQDGNFKSSTVLDDGSSTNDTNNTNDDSLSLSSSTTATTSTSSGFGGGCPVQKKKKKGLGLFGGGGGGSVDEGSSGGGECPIKAKHPPAQQGQQQQQQEIPSECPMRDSSKKNNQSPPQVQYNVYSQPIDATNNMPVVANQLPSAHQEELLSTERIKSTIPKGGTSNGETWTYPSPQMFYNSLARKSKLGDTEESEIESVVSIHNNMNEKTWAKVLEWEEVLDPITTESSSSSSTNQQQQQQQTQQGPKLLKFMGRPSDLSPKAYLKNLFFSHPLPFDRHDWTIQRPNGTQVRYVIDYYHDESRAKETEDSAFPAMHDRDAIESILVDVRPAVIDLEELMSGGGGGDEGLGGGLGLVGKRFGEGLGVLVGRGWTMPYARWVGGGTTYEPLSVRPSKALKEQVKESEKVWESIQQNVLESKGLAATGSGGGSGSKSMVMDENDKLVSSSGEGTSKKTITDEEAKVVAKNFATVLQQCADARKEVDEAENESDYAKTSLALSMCMARIVCPLQQDVVVDAITAEGDDDERVYDARVDAALENMVLCVNAKDQAVVEAKQSHPGLFNL